MTVLFSFLGDYYRRVKGTALGARFAPSYANLFMGFWELNYIWANNLFGMTLVLYGRCINDIIIWNGTDIKLPHFLAHCASNPSNTGRYMKKRE